MLCKSALESSRAATERARRASRYGSDDLELIEMSDSVDLLRSLEDDSREGPAAAAEFGRVVSDVVLVVVVVVVVLIIVSLR